MARSPSAPFRRTTRTACIVRLRVERFVGGEAGQGVRSQLERVDDAAVAAAQGLLGLDPLGCVASVKMLSEWLNQNA